MCASQFFPKNKNGDTYYFVYDPTASIPAVVYEQGTKYRYVNVREPDGALISREKYQDDARIGSYAYHFDGLGSTRAITDESSAVVDRYDYDAWGNETLPFTHLADNPYRYVGQYGYYHHYQEPDFKMLQLGVRYYDVNTGRFTQRDLKKDGINYYVYCMDNPSARIDPDGLKCTPITSWELDTSPGYKRNDYAGLEYKHDWVIYDWHPAGGGLLTARICYCHWTSEFSYRTKYKTSKIFNRTLSCMGYSKFCKRWVRWQEKESKSEVDYRYSAWLPLGGYSNMPDDKNRMVTIGCFGMPTTWGIVAGEQADGDDQKAYCMCTQYSGKKPY